MSGYGQRQHRRSTRRSWGWHPLQPEWAESVVASSDLGGRLVVDVGAGNGALTEPLVRRGARVIAVELNRDRAAALRDRFAGDAVTVVRADIAELRWPRKPFQVVASPPYNLTTQLVRRLLSLPALHSADLVLQRAAAKRLVREPVGRHAGRYTFELGMSIPRKAFNPPPKVDSVVLRIRRR
ncbi:rRNA adenine N-6-methyltransferase family protein [Solicola gregarius]|uniref:Methyltransferase domain-containing protein n=1 Tax=Solicola gregarius TaxID=2908642 RepID=A0AA46TL78_9ACTN|nr:rRNA adenine N-6-methyltransferase family protein [Solicola gregarius]UYM07336.1 methyltransferase domain-containing protein [Solicola gregarius]